MKSLRLDMSGDLVIEGGQLQEVRGVGEVQQRFRQLLRTNKNEWFLDPEEGFEYLVVRGKNVNQEDVQAELMDVADQVEEIDRIENVRLDFDRRERKLTVFFVAILASGEELEMGEVI